MLTKEELKKKEQDHNIQFIVLLQLIVEKIEFLESQGYLYGSIKSFLKNSKTKYEQFITKVFKIQDVVDGQTAQDATNKLVVMQERVEKALLNEYVLTIDERKQRARGVLRTLITAPFKEGDDPTRTEARKELLIDDILEGMEQNNLFNF